MMKIVSVVNSKAVVTAGDIDIGCLCDVKERGKLYKGTIVSFGKTIIIYNYGDNNYYKWLFRYKGRCKNC